MALRNKENSKLRINVGYVINRENISGIPEITAALKEIGINAIRFKVNIRPNEGQVLSLDESSSAIKKVQEAKVLADESFKVVAIHNEGEIKEGIGDVGFSRCWFAHLYTTWGPTGDMYVCDHQAFSGSGGSFGGLRGGLGFDDVWNARVKLLDKFSPLQMCTVCPPMGRRVNKLMQLLSALNEENPELFIYWLRNDFLAGLMKEKTMTYLKAGNYKKAGEMQFALAELQSSGRTRARILLEEIDAAAENGKRIDWKSENKRERVLIFGGLGFLGAQTVKHILNGYPNAEILVVTRRDYSSYENNLPRELVSEVNMRDSERRIRVLTEDMLDYDLILKLIDDYHPSMIYHLASDQRIFNTKAYTAQQFCEIFFDNLLMTRNVLRAIKTLGMIKAVRFVYTSTLRVYGKWDKDEEVNERTPINFAHEHPYDIAKFFSELMINQYRKEGLRAVIVRPGNLFPKIVKLVDGSSRSREVVSVFTRRILLGQPLLMGPGAKESIFTFVPVEDCAHFLASLVRSSSIIPDLVNFVGEENFTIPQLGRLICTVVAPQKMALLHFDHMHSEFDTHATGKAKFSTLHRDELVRLGFIWEQSNIIEAFHDLAIRLAEEGVSSKNPPADAVAETSELSIGWIDLNSPRPQSTVTFSWQGTIAVDAQVYIINKQHQTFGSQEEAKQFARDNIEGIAVLRAEPSEGESYNIPLSLDEVSPFVGLDEHDYHFKGVVDLASPILKGIEPGKYSLTVMFRAGRTRWVEFGHFAIRRMRQYPYPTVIVPGVNPADDNASGRKNEPDDSDQPRGLRGNLNNKSMEQINSVIASGEFEEVMPDEAKVVSERQEIKVKFYVFKTHPDRAPPEFSTSKWEGDTLHIYFSEKEYANWIALFGKDKEELHIANSALAAHEYA